jgi:hypothetical protein
MKVTDLRRGLLAALAAGGMIAPSATYAANLNTDLVVNGGFETVDPATTGAYNSPRISNWLGQAGFAYSHDGSSSNAGVVPNYANGAIPPNTGHWYFTSNVGTPDIANPGQFYQDINVAGGDTGNTIGLGFAGFNLSAFMSTYFNPGRGNTDSDTGSIHLDFRSSSGVSLGTNFMNDSDRGTANVWNENTKTGIIPVGTATIRLSAYGIASNGGPDGYIDNVALSISVVPLPSLRITVNRNTGNITLSNDTGSAVNISGYSITSAFESLSPNSWLSIAENYDSGNPGPGQVDAAHSWSELTNPVTHGDLSEADLQAGTGTSLTNNRTVNLGNSAWIHSPNEDLVFQYVSGGQVKDGIISYIGNNGNPFTSGDLDFSGGINSTDWAILRNAQHTNLTTLSKAQAYALGDLNGDLRNDFADFALFKQAYDVANGSGSFAEMVASIPEPTTTLLVLVGGTLLFTTSRRNRTTD